MDKEVLDLLRQINSKLDEHTQILNSHTQILNEHTQILNEHDNKFAKLEIAQEEIKSKLDLIAEGETAHFEQNERQHNQIINDANKRFDVLEISVTSIAKDVKDIKKDLGIMEQVTVKNWGEIIELKKVK